MGNECSVPPRISGISDFFRISSWTYLRLYDFRHHLYNRFTLSSREGGPYSPILDDVVAVVILDYKAPDMTRACVRSLPPNVEAIVIDNSETNLGFAAGCNIGIKRALDMGADYVWLLNNDAIARPDTLDRLLTKMTPGVGAVGSVILNADNSVQVWGGGYLRIGRSLVLRSRGDFTWLSACSLLITREALEATGGFDEGFFMYWEDVDLSFRIKDAGLDLAVADDAYVTHLCMGGVRHSPASLIRFFRKRTALWPLHVLVAAFLALARRLRKPGTFMVGNCQERGKIS